MSASKKTSVIEKLFNDKWDAKHQVLKGSPIVTLKELTVAIKAASDLSPLNPANFFKDFIRVRSSANKNWPKSVWESGFVALQVTGGGNVFEFVKVSPNQAEPFPPLGAYPRDPNARRYTLQSLSLPLAARLLGRKDESWLTQVAVRLFLIENHVALHSDEYLHVSHLQMGVKQKESEIDALYLGSKNNGDEVIITVEAKGRKDDILETQLLKQIQAVLRMSTLKGKKCVLPMAMKIIEPSVVYVASYSEIPLGSHPPKTLGEIVSEAVYTLKPGVPGIQ